MYVCIYVYMFIHIYKNFILKLLSYMQFVKWFDRCCLFLQITSHILTKTRLFILCVFMQLYYHALSHVDALYTYRYMLKSMR